MEHRDARAAMQHLITAFNIAAPNDEAQRAFVAAIADYRKHETYEPNVLRYAVGMFYDGLAYGNWPQ